MNKRKTECELPEAKHVRVTGRADKSCVHFSTTCMLPDAKPVSVTTSQPDQASYRLLVNSHADSFFLLLICINTHKRLNNKHRWLKIKLLDQLTVRVMQVRERLTIPHQPFTAEG